MTTAIPRPRGRSTLPLPTPSSRLRHRRPGPTPSGLPPADLMAALRGRYTGPRTPREQEQYARMLAASRTVVPLEYQNRPGDLVALMAHAIALDIPLPLAWGHLVFGDGGRAGMTGILMHGLLIRAGHRIVPLHADDREVRMQLVRGDGQPGGQARWTIGEAMRAGLLERAMWRRYPADMLWWRCLARLTRRWAPDVVMGLGYTPDEVEHGVVDEPAGDTPVDVDGNPAPRVDVATFLAGVDTKPWTEIRALLRQAHDLGISGAYAGMSGGVALTVEDVIINAGEAARKREAADQAAAVATDADEPASLTVPAAPLPPPGSDGPVAWCGCPATEIIATGNHRPGCAYHLPPTGPGDGQP